MRSHPAILLSDCEKKDPEYQHETCSKYRYARDVPEYRNVYSSVWGNSNKYSGRQSDCEAEKKINTEPLPKDTNLNVKSRRHSRSQSNICFVGIAPSIP